MSDIRINLLPWREELREEKKKEFLNVLVGVVIFAGAIIFAVDRYYNAAIDTQKERNAFVSKEISLLEDRITEIKKLQEKRTDMIARMKVIEELQGNRPIIVRLFDELARRLSDRVFYLSLNLKGKLLSIQGVAESNNRISNQLRNFDDSEWFTNPNVTAINADVSFGPQASKFNLNVQKATPNEENEEEEEQ